MATTELYIGREVLRKEDPELLTGQANYIDNHTLPGMVWMAMVRPPYVHATINAIDTSAAKAMPGVVGVYTAADLEVGGLPFVWPITEDIKIPNHYPLTKDKIRFHGDAVAVVVAETREQAIDAAETVSVDVTELPAVIDMEAAMADGAPLIHEELGSNVTVHCPD
jgi:aerobic carbon-monoxide dehydrogenase large subunit